MDFSETTLWRNGFEGPYADIDEAKRLKNAFMEMRRHVELLVGEISADLRQYTVHDITHLDALWSVGSEILGADFRLTPTEAFVLGGAFLLHDAGMSLAAYPRGVSEIYEQPSWPMIVRDIAGESRELSKEELGRALPEFLRLEHANRAQHLVQLEWTAPDGSRRAILENADLRQKFGKFIGEVAASHWWSHERLSESLNRVIPAPPPFSSAWSIDLLKVASILRVSDVAHIDERRAPGFLWAIRGRRFSAESKKHWLFQNRLTQPERRGDALHYSSTIDFQKSEAESWWLAYDTLKIVDEELRQTDVLLADLRGDQHRFAARRVANTETPLTATKTMGVSGWVPIDTSIHVTDVMGLIKNLGGEALYGRNELVPLRELVQNASDAIVLRSAIQSGGQTDGGRIVVLVGQDGDRQYLEVQDNGVGMNADIIRKNLLNFGESGWVRDPIFSDYPTKSFNKIKTTGKFGIGFFSLFMLAERVELWTRRFDRGFDETLHLEFEGGLGRRPLLSRASQNEWMMEGGTKVRVWLNDVDAFLGSHGLNIKNDRANPKQALSELFPALASPITFRWQDKEVLIDGTKWQTEPAIDLVLRTSGVSSLSEHEVRYCANVTPLYKPDGALAGRMCIAPDSESRRRAAYGVVAVKGVAATRVSGTRGLVEGEAIRAARDVANPSVSSAEWKRWASEQAILLKGCHLGAEQEIEGAQIVRAFGGNPGPLRICETSEGCLSSADLRAYLSERQRVSIVSDTRLSLKRRNAPFTLEPEIIAVDSSVPGLFQYPREVGGVVDPLWLDVGAFHDRTLEGIVAEIVGDTWGIDRKLLEEIMNATEEGKYSKYEVPIIVGRHEGKEIFEFANILSRSLNWNDLPERVTKARAARKACGDYDEYFGE